MICLIDADPLQEKIMRDFLEGSGYRVVAYSTFEDFQAGFDPSDVSAIVLDFQPESALGLAVVSHLAKLGIKTPFVAVTSLGSVSTAVKCMQLGAVTVLEKPLDQTLLLNSISSAAQITLDRRKNNCKKLLILERIGRLTSRETEVLKFVMEGKSSKDVAKLIGCSAKTVDVHRSRIVTKLEVGSINEVLYELILADLTIANVKKQSS